MLFVSLMYNPGLQSEVCFSFPLLCAQITSGLIHFLHYHKVLSLGVLIINESRISVKKCCFPSAYWNILWSIHSKTTAHVSPWRKELVVTRGVLAMHGPCSAVRSMTLGKESVLQAPNYHSSVLDKETDFQLLYWKLSLESGGNIYFSSFIRNLSAVVAVSFICIK